MIREEDYIAINQLSIKKIEDANLTYKRYLYNNINWRTRLICIRGARGTGKTTMLLQYAKEHFDDLTKVLYISLDDMRFESILLKDVAEYAVQHGVKTLLIDEVHYHPHWERMLKNIYDNYSDLQVIYTGSSVLRIAKSEADLSRRQTYYDLTGFSFREYLMFKGIATIEPISYEQLLANSTRISLDIVKQIKPFEWFGEYLRNGYYPFTLMPEQDYYQRIQSIINLVIYQDIPQIDEVSFSSLQKARKLLTLLATVVPLEPNISTLCREIGAAREVVVKLLYLLDKAGMLALLQKETNSYKELSRPDKIYLDNTNLMYALSSFVNRGTLRETFLMNQLRQNHSILFPSKGDFLIDEQYTIEVGGKDKTFKQIKDIPDSYLAVDDTEIGFGNRIPLWLFGFLY